MTYQQLLDAAYHFMGQTAGTELVSQSDLIFFMNLSQSYVSGYNDFPFLKFEKVFYTTGDNISISLLSPSKEQKESAEYSGQEINKFLSTDADIFSVYSIKGNDETSLREVAGVPANDDEYSISHRTITTFKNFNFLSILASFDFPVIENTTEFLSKEMVMPSLVIGAIYHFTLSHCLPIYLADGEPSAKFHHDMAQSMIERVTTKYASQKGVRQLIPKTHG